MTKTPAHVETALLSRVRPHDVPGVAWSLAVGFVPRVTGRPLRPTRALPAMSWLSWCMVVLVLPGVRHHERRIVVRVARRGLGAQAVLALRIFGLVVLLEIFFLAILIVPDVLDLWRMRTTAVVLVVLVGWLVVSLVSSVALTVPVVAQIWRVGVEARRRLGKERVAADLAAMRATRWTVDTVTSRLPHGGLARVVAHVRATVPAGESVLVQASSGNHTRLYERYGLVPLEAAPWTLIGTSPGQDSRARWVNVPAVTAA